MNYDNDELKKKFKILKLKYPELEYTLGWFLKEIDIREDEDMSIAPLETVLDELLIFLEED